MDFNNEKDYINEVENTTVSEEVVINDCECSEEIEVNEEANTPVKTKKSIFYTPILISIVAFLLSAIIIFGTIFVFDKFFSVDDKEKNVSVVGVWEVADQQGSGYYYIFDDDGSFRADLGARVMNGTYTTEEKETVSADSSEEKETNLVVTFSPCIFSDFEDQAVVTMNDDKTELTLSFPYSGQISFVRSELPEYKLDASEITHASADEYGIVSFAGDSKIVGSWSMEYSGIVETYTFHENGLGECVDKFVDDNYSITTKFRYTVHDGKILITMVLYNGETADGTMDYYLDKGKLIINNLAYDPV